MNKRNSKLIRKVCSVTNVPLSFGKKEWNQTPRNKRFALRKEYQETIKQRLEEVT